ncbi:MAG: hypothetical protein Q4E53_12970 [Eubacteriales bacterium]|nr:hypothetical protein [Eubacteriales bacterium]
MLKITLLSSLYKEFEKIIYDKKAPNYKSDRRFLTMERSYPEAAGIDSVTMEERYLPKSILYYIWVNDEKETRDLSDKTLCKWILAFAQDYKLQFLKSDIPENPLENGFSILDCFDASKIPDYRKNTAYSDLTITRMEDVKNKSIVEDTRKATFPGMTFSKKYKEERWGKE